MTNPNQCAATMGEKEILNDCLTGQKQLTSAYNTFAGECVDPRLRSTFLDILEEEHCIQADLFDDMTAKGWYQTEPAEPGKVAQTRQKLSRG
jgi:spore coat protein CotF